MLHGLLHLSSCLISSMNDDDDDDDDFPFLCACVYASLYVYVLPVHTFLLNVRKRPKGEEGETASAFCIAHRY